MYPKLVFFAGLKKKTKKLGEVIYKSNVNYTPLYSTLQRKPLPSTFFSFQSQDLLSFKTEKKKVKKKKRKKKSRDIRNSRYTPALHITRSIVFRTSDSTHIPLV